MRILLTGAAGFVGAAITADLTAAGHDVVGVDAYLPEVHPVRPDPVSDPVTHLDLRDRDGLDRMLPGVDAVCHQAAMVGAEVDAQDLPGYVAHNVAGTAELLAGMARHGISRLVQASSMVVYGDGAYRCPAHGRVRPGPRAGADLAAGRFEPRCPVGGEEVAWQTVDEEDRLAPRTAYAGTKLAQEHLAEAWTAHTGGSVISLRYHNIYGPGMPRDTPYAGVAAIFRSANAAGRAARVYEDGGQLRDFVHVEDVARANRLALLRLVDGAGPAGGHRAYTVASGEPRPIIDLARLLADAVGAPAPEVVGGGRPGDVRHIVASPARAARELGFTAAVGFADGVTRFATEPMRASVLGG